MTPEPIHLLTIIAEGVLEDRLVRLVEELGSTGWTATSCRGHSAHGVDAGEFEGGNVRIEVLVPEGRLEALWQRLADDYFERYGVTAWSVAVRVLRGAKYGT